jgi:peptide/nickel transport system substrate-binding protein
MKRLKDPSGSASRGRLWRGLLAGCLALIAAFAIPVMALDTTAKAQMKTLVLAIEGEPSRLDPHTHVLWLTYRETYLIYESFVQQDLTIKDVPRPPVIPALATSWDVSDDKLHYTFHLRKGVKFHDGTPWNAEVAKFNFDRVLDKDFEYFYPLANGFNTWWHGDIDTYEVVDEYTFRVNMKQPNSEFIRRLSQGGFGSSGMISPEVVKKYGNDDAALHAVGTGPFKLTERVFGEKIVLDKNPDYWDEKRIPRVDRLIIRGISDVATRELALLTGEVDIIATPSPDSVDYLETQGMVVDMAPITTIYNLWVNTRMKPLDDHRVRKALYMAIDREGLCKYLRRGQCSPAYSILNYGGPGHDPNYKPFAYDPAGAKKLLAEAGYPDGFEVRVDWTPGGAGDVNTVADAEWIQRDWARIGVKLNIELFEISTYMDTMAKGMREGTGFMQLSWGESAFHWLDAVISPHALPPNGFNAGYYDNPAVGEHLAKARAALSDEGMVKELREVERIVIEEDTAFIPTHSPWGVYAMRPNVKGFVLAPQHWHDMTIVDKE